MKLESTVQHEIDSENLYNLFSMDRRVKIGRIDGHRAYRITTSSYLLDTRKLNKKFNIVSIVRSDYGLDVYVEGKGKA